MCIQRPQQMIDMTMNTTQLEHEEAQKMCPHNKLTVRIIELRSRSYSRHAGFRGMFLDKEICEEEDFDTAHIVCDDCKKWLTSEEAMKIIFE